VASSSSVIYTLNSVIRYEAGMQGATQISTALGSHSFPSASHQQQQGSQASKQAAMGLVVLGFQQVRGPPTLARTHTHAHATRNNKRNVKS